MKPVSFGILATGKIAARVATTMQGVSSCHLVAAASRSAENADHFAKRFSIEGIVGYETLLDREDIDAIYLATPHPQHYEWCLRAIHHGKSVLCEKPFTMTVAEAEEIVQAAQERGVLIAEAFMYRFHPQTKVCAELVRSGSIGEVHWISADFGFAADYHPEGRLFSRKLGGGGILDVGCYAASMARLIAGAASEQTFLDPILIKGSGKLDDAEGTDWLAGAILEFPNQVMATLRCSTKFKIGGTVLIEGTHGTIAMNEPWMAGSRGATITLTTDQEKKIIQTQNDADLYSFMVEEFCLCQQEGKMECASMSPADSIGNMRVLESWYQQAGVSYTS